MEKTACIYLSVIIYIKDHHILVISQVPHTNPINFIAIATQKNKELTDTKGLKNVKLREAQKLQNQAKYPANMKV